MKDQAMTTPAPTDWQQPTTPPTPKRSRRPLLILAALAVLLFAGVAVGVGLAVGGGDKPAPTKTASAWDAEQASKALTPVEENSAPEPAVTEGPTLEASDVKLTLKTTDKQCFGSAGCNVSVKVQMSYEGLPLSADDTWEVTYEISGGDEGQTIGSFEVTGDQYTVNEESLSAASSKSKLHVKVTDVEKVGL